MCRVKNQQLVIIFALLVTFAKKKKLSKLELTLSLGEVKNRLGSFDIKETQNNISLILILFTAL